MGIMDGAVSFSQLKTFTESDIQSSEIVRFHKDKITTGKPGSWLGHAVFILKKYIFRRIPAYFSWEENCQIIANEQTYRLAANLPSPLKSRIIHHLKDHESLTFQSLKGFVQEVQSLKSYLDSPLQARKQFKEQIATGVIQDVTQMDDLSHKILNEVRGVKLEPASPLWPDMNPELYYQYVNELKASSLTLHLLSCIKPDAVFTPSSVEEVLSQIRLFCDQNKPVELPDHPLLKQDPTSYEQPKRYRATETIRIAYMNLVEVLCQRVAEQEAEPLIEELATPTLAYQTILNDITCGNIESVEQLYLLRARIDVAMRAHEELLADYDREFTVLKLTLKILNGVSGSLTTSSVNRALHQLATEFDLQDHFPLSPEEDATSTEQATLIIQLKPSEIPCHISSNAVLRALGNATYVLHQLAGNS